MTEEKIGLGDDKIRLIKKNDELALAIMKQQKLPEEKATLIAYIMRYNMWTMAQFGDLTGYAPSTITNLTRPFYNKAGELVTELDFCYPFKSLEGSGPKFIIRNEKSESFLPKVE